MLQRIAGLDIDVNGAVAKSRTESFVHFLDFGETRLTHDFGEPEADQLDITKHEVEGIDPAVFARQQSVVYDATTFANAVGETANRRPSNRVDAKLYTGATGFLRNTVGKVRCINNDHVSADFP